MTTIERAEKAEAAVLRWWQEARLQRDEVLYLEELIGDLLGGYEGACMTCEPVARENVRLKCNLDESEAHAKRMAEVLEPFLGSDIDPEDKATIHWAIADYRAEYPETK